MSRGQFAQFFGGSALVGLELASGDLDESVEDPDTAIAATALHIDRRDLMHRLFGPPGQGGSALRGLVLKVPEAASIGRRDVDIVVDDPSVSQHHGDFRLLPGTGRHCYRDCSSTNGSFHNGVKLGAMSFVPLNPGDELRLGRVVLIFLSAGQLHDYLNDERL